MPSRLTSSCVGEMPTALAARAGLRIEEPVSSAIAQVTRFAATAEPDPELEPMGLRSVSYGLQNVPPNELRGMPDAYSPRLALARMIAPAARRRATNVASSGARSFGVGRIGAGGAAHVVRVVLVLDREHDAVQRPDELARGGESGVEVGGDLERIGHRRVVVGGVRHAARLALVEAPFRARGGAQVQRLQRVDLARVRESS